MGLDNGIILRTKNKIENIPYYVDVQYSPVNEEYTICYWRKCGTLRDEILTAIDAEPDEYSFELSTGDVQNIIDVILSYFSDISYWDDVGNSIWNFKEMIPHFAQDIVNLEWLMDYMKDNVAAVVEFYDSY